MSFRLPDNTKRLAIIGRTGSGKSVKGAWALSLRNFDAQPWTIIDPKRDELLNSLGAVEVDPGDKPPKAPGLYIMHPVPDSEDDTAVDEYLRNVIQRAVDNRQPHGLLFDEGYSIPKNSKAFGRIQTQGRSLRVPTITLVQRPVGMDRRVWSEADFIDYIDLSTPHDQKIVGEWMPIDMSVKTPEFCSRWYDVGQNKVYNMGPAPDPDRIIDAVRKKLGPAKRFRRL